MTRTSWSTIGVRRGARRLVGARRLAMLLRWLRGDVLVGVNFFDTSDDDHELVSAFAIDWSGFPHQEALDALNDADDR